tara:strand:+ start:6700 stop:6918 length:219 start_codon:yes stop_codon:yes gene_type:complete
MNLSLNELLDLAQIGRTSTSASDFIAGLATDFNHCQRNNETCIISLDQDYELIFIDPEADRHAPETVELSDG